MGAREKATTALSPPAPSSDPEITVEDLPYDALSIILAKATSRIGDRVELKGLGPLEQVRKTK
jgi:hypothetical protein